MKLPSHRGFLSEALTASFFLKNRRWTLHSWREKVFNIEVDLILKKDSQFLALEVKSLSSSLEDFPRIQRNQILRLKMAASFLRESLPGPLSFGVSFVEYQAAVPKYIWFRSLSDFLLE